MALIVWNARFETGFTIFDDHHKHLVVLLNKVAALCAGRNQTSEISEVLGELVSYTQYHFAAEEEWMRDHKYPDFDKHHGEHVALLQSVASYMQRLDRENTVGITDELLSFLKQWLLSHILANDIKLGAFAKSLNAA